ncbi:Os07g0616850, partial [Oryza sativa Japonica Group]
FTPGSALQQWSTHCPFFSPGKARSFGGGLSLNGQWNGGSHLAVLEGVQHLQVAACLTPVEVGDILPETVDTGESHQPLRVELPCVLLLDALKSTLRDLDPVVWVFLTLLKELHEQRRGLVVLVRINVVARHAVHDDLGWTTIGSCKCWKTTGHGLNHS